MKYMFFVCTDATAPAYDPEQDDVEEWVAELTASGAHRDGDRLRPPSDATTVAVRDGRIVVSDGPFAETKDWIAGYDVIECADLDEAIAIAARHSMARFGRIEIRPFWPMGA